MSRMKDSSKIRNDSQEQGSDHTRFLAHVLDQAAAVLAANPTDARRVRYVRALPHIMTEWHAQPRYMGSNDRPRQLKLKGRGPSLSELVASVLPGEDPSRVAQALIDGKAVQFKAGKYIAVSRQVSFAGDLDLARAHSIGILSGQISTIQHNVGCAESKDRALEREAFNLNIPVRLLPDIHREIRKDGIALLDRLDGLLHENQVQPGSEPTVGLGVSISAYQDQWEASAHELRREENPPATNRSAMPAIDRNVAEAIQRLVRICRMYGASQEQFIDCARQEYFKHAKSPPRPRLDATREIPQATEVMTIWHDDPRYTLNGKPRALLKRGRSPSFEMLVSEVDRNLDVDEVLRYLIRTGTVKRRGACYIAIRDAVIVHGVQGPAVDWALRGLAQMLAVAENNLTVTDIRDGLFERRVENSRVPVSKIPVLKEFIEEEGMSLLRRGRTLMRDLQLQRRRGEPTVEAGLGIYRLQSKKVLQPDSGKQSAANRRVGSGMRRNARSIKRSQ